jgi:hypothetical protein
MISRFTAISCGPASVGLLAGRESCLNKALKESNAECEDILRQAWSKGWRFTPEQIERGARRHVEALSCSRSTKVMSSARAKRKRKEAQSVGPVSARTAFTFGIRRSSRPRVHRVSTEPHGKLPIGARKSRVTKVERAVTATGDRLFAFPGALLVDHRPTPLPTGIQQRPLVGFPEHQLVGRGVAS